MSEQNDEQGYGEREAGQERGRLAIGQGKASGKFFEGYGFILGIGQCEMSSCDQAGEEREKEKSDGEK